MEFNFLYGKSFLSISDINRDDIERIIELGIKFKELRKKGVPHRYLEGKYFALLFQKPSLRTRLSFEVGIDEMGGKSFYYTSQDIGPGTRESLEDIALVISRYADGIIARVFGHNILVELSKYATIPVINALSDFSHPCQILADLMTLKEKKGKIDKLKIAWIGDGNNVANSLIYGAWKMGYELVLATPEGYEPERSVVQIALDGGAKVSVVRKPLEAAEGADCLYTDAWASMGQEREREVRLIHFKGYQINAQLLSVAKPDAIILHCLPAHYGEELDYEVSRSANSAIFDQAENRLHAQKALLALIYNEKI